MSKPITLDEARQRGLLVAGEGVHTFSNGTDWECWASANCWECSHYDWDAVGACALEGASQLGIASGALVQLFGWRQHETYRDSWIKPDVCRFFHQRRDGENGQPVPPPFVDPAQLVLLADPTEDAAMIQQAPVLKEVTA